MSDPIVRIEGIEIEYEVPQLSNTPTSLRISTRTQNGQLVVVLISESAARELVAKLKEHPLIAGSR